MVALFTFVSQKICCTLEEQEYVSSLPDLQLIHADNFLKKLLFCHLKYQKLCHVGVLNLNPDSMGLMAGFQLHGLQFSGMLQ